MLKPLYHGTIYKFDEIDVSAGKGYKDFGKGFYLTPNKETAVRMAKKKARLFGDSPVLITYELDDAIMQSGLNIKIFPEQACVEWFLFVDANRDRKNKKPIHDYDVVVGPIADDGVVLQITNYHEGIYSPEQAAKLLQDKYLDQQYYFGTQKALTFLHKVKTESL